MRPDLKLVVFDETDVSHAAARFSLQRLFPSIERRDDGTAFGTGGLTRWWRIGAGLHRLVRHADASMGASSWEQALTWATSIARARGRRIGELQIWGHGGWGYMGLGKTHLDREALSSQSPLAHALDSFRTELSNDALFWVRCCSAFGAASGRAFAPALADRLSARVAGHTFIIGGLQSGTHSIAPGDIPTWDPDEGIERRPNGPAIPRESSVGAPHTISCLRLGLPNDW